MKKNILITGVGGRSVGSGILHSLLRSPSSTSDLWNIHSADADSFSWGLYKTAKHVIVPFASSKEYVPFIQNYVIQNKIDAIIPGTEIETQILLENEKLISCKIIANKLDLIPLMMDKFETQKKLIDLGLNNIESVPLKDWKQITSKYGFPVIIKPTKGTGGSKGLNIALDEEEIIDLLEIMDPNNAPCIQPYIGDENEEYTVGVLSDKDGNLIDSIVLKRKLIGLSLLQTRETLNKKIAISTGYSQGYIIKDERIQKFCEELAIKLDSRGPLNIQLRIQDDKIFIFEIHPRFSGTTPFRADVGFNEVDLLLRNVLFGEQFGRLQYRFNLAVIRAFEHVIVPIEEM